jgi:hypothetical protein
MKFWDSEIVQSEFNFDMGKKLLISNLDLLHGMSVEESTLYKKWSEFNDDLHTSMKRLPVLQSYFDTIWTPIDIMDKDLTIKEILSLQPYVELTDDTIRWTDIRKLISSMEFTPNPGRNVKAFVKDRVSGKLLGVISLGSDVTSLGVRDKFIGWTKDNKFKDGKLNNTAIGTSIVPTQPLGFNFLGGKLIAALTTSPIFRSEWETKYNNTLVAVGTTSLYGASSQYNGIPHFKTLGESAGKVNIKPDDKFYDPWHQWLKETHSDWYKKNISDERERNGANMGYGTNGPVSGVKQKIIGKIFKECGIKNDTYHHGFKRGVYFAPMYENGNQYLCNKIEVKDLVMKPKFAEGDDYTIKWWKDKAIKRYTTLHTENRLKNETLFYSNIIGMQWEDCKTKYLKDIGR